LELGVLTENVTVMLLIVLAEAALGWNFVFWSYFVVIFRVGVDVLYRRAISTPRYLTCKIFLSATCTLNEPDKHFSHKWLLYFAFFVKWVTVWLISECQKFVKKLFAFFSKEKSTKKPIVSFDRVYQKISKALDVSYTSVHRIMNGKRPCKSNRPKESAKILDDFDHCVIKRTIHGLYSRKIAPTVSIIHKKIKD
jgi:hypothetical protein